MKVIYKGWGDGNAVAPFLAIDDNRNSRTFGWLMAQHPDGQWVTCADLKPLVQLFDSPKDAPK